MTPHTPERASRVPASAQVSRLTLILGPTGAGKTARAAELARATGARVLVLDRVQCHRELAVGSGRADSSACVPREFLGDRAVADGVIDAETCYANLVRALRTGGTRPTILEGGSLSLLELMARRPEWRVDADVDIDYVRPVDGNEQRVRDRVGAMLTGDHTMLDEVRALWPDPRTHAVLRGIVGYREIIAAAGDDTSFHGPGLDRLADSVATAHLRHAETQVALFDSLLAGALRPGIGHDHD